jgi:hypothetical protein
MAKATVKFRQIIQPIESVTLDISQNEALTLLTILGRVGGCPFKSPRRHGDSILEALRTAINIKYDELRETSEHKAMAAADHKGHRNSIYFEDYSED